MKEQEVVPDSDRIHDDRIDSCQMCIPLKDTENKTKNKGDGVFQQTLCSRGIRKRSEETHRETEYRIIAKKGRSQVKTPKGKV